MIWRCKKLGFLTALMLISLILAGCWSSEEIEDIAIVSIVGFDKIKVGTKDLWRVSAHVIKPSALGQGTGGSFGGGSGGGEPKATWVVSGIGETIEEAFGQIAERSGRRIFAAHANLVLLGEGLAREGVYQVADYLLRFRDLRLEAWVLACRGEALDILRAEPEMESGIAKEIKGMISESQAKISRTAVIRVKDFVNDLITPGKDAAVTKIEVFTPAEKPQDQSVAPGQGNPPTAVKMSGSAVFRKDKLVGWMEGDETFGYLTIVNKAQSASIPLKIHDTSKKDLSFLMTRAKSSITPLVEKDRIGYYIDIKMEGDIGEHEGMYQFAQPKEWAKVEEKAKEQIQEIIVRSVNLAQEELKADIFGLGDILHKSYPELWSQVKNDWDRIYPELDITVNLEVKIRRTGMTNNPPLIIQ